jgi:membrane protein
VNSCVGELPKSDRCVPGTIVPMGDANSLAKYPRRVGRRLLAAYHGFNEHDGFLMAAAIAYYVALSFFPLLLVLVAGLGFALQSTAVGQDAQERLLAAVEQQASPELSSQIGSALAVVSERASSRGPIGFAALLVTAVLIFVQVDHAFNRIWRTEDDRNRGWLRMVWQLIFQRLKALLMLLAAGAFVLAATIAPLVWSGIEKALQPAVDVGQEISGGVAFSINVFFNFLAFALVYRFVPRVKIDWLAALQGGVVAALLWEIGRQVLAVYLVRQGYPTAYGVIGSFIAIMLWAYYGMLVVFFGAEYTRAVGEDAGKSGT